VQLSLFVHPLPCHLVPCQQRGIAKGSTLEVGALSPEQVISKGWTSESGASSEQVIARGWTLGVRESGTDHGWILQDGVVLRDLNHARLDKGRGSHSRGRLTVG